MSLEQRFFPVTKRGLVVFISSLILYVLIYLVVEKFFGQYSAGIFSLLPAIVAGYTLGMKFGFIATFLLVVPITNLLNSFVANQTPVETISTPDNIYGIFAVIMTTLVVGRMYDLRHQLQTELHERAQIEHELRILNAKLQQQTEEAESANEELETLLYIVSHDLKEPLRTITNFSNILQTRYTDQLNEKGLDFFQRIEKAGGRMSELMDDLLILSRIRRQELDKQMIAGNELVQESLGRLENMIEISNATITIQDPLPTLCVNRTWSVEAIYNLIHNALKFTKDGDSPEVTIQGYQDAGTRGLIIKDRGIGVKPEYASRIFKLFQRAVSRQFEGTGTGLAIVEHVAQRHDGKAWVETRKGGGSAFYITFSHPSD